MYGQGKTKFQNRVTLVGIKCEPCDLVSYMLTFQHLLTLTPQLPEVINMSLLPIISIYYPASRSSQHHHNKKYFRHLGLSIKIQVTICVWLFESLHSYLVLVLVQALAVKELIATESLLQLVTQLRG